MTLNGIRVILPLPLLRNGKPSTLTRSAQTASLYGNGIENALALRPVSPDGDRFEPDRSTPVIGYHQVDMPFSR